MESTNEVKKIGLSELPSFDLFKGIAMDKEMSILSQIKAFLEKKIQMLMIVSWMMMMKSLNRKMKEILLMF